MWRKDELEADIEKWLSGLEIQRNRVLVSVQAVAQNPDMHRQSEISPHHDADFYFILLRRAYRVLEKKAKENPRVANLKGQYKDLYPKIKIRDHSEHLRIEDLPTLSPGSPVVIKMGIVSNPDGVYISSGDQTWHLDTDHERFVELMSKFLELQPFSSDKEEES